MPRAAKIALLIFFIVLLTTGGILFLYFQKSPPTLIQPYLQSTSLPNFSRPTEESGKIEAKSELDGYQLKLQDATTLESFINNWGFFSTAGYSLPGADQAPSYVPRESLHNTLNKVKITLCSAERVSLYNPPSAPGDIPIYTSASLNQHTLEIGLCIFKSTLELLKSNQITTDLLSRRLTSELIWYLAKISGKYGPENPPTRPGIEIQPFLIVETSVQ